MAETNRLWYVDVVGNGVVELIGPAVGGAKNVLLAVTCSGLPAAELEVTARRVADVLEANWAPSSGLSELAAIMPAPPAGCRWRARKIGEPRVEVYELIRVGVGRPLAKISPYDNVPGVRWEASCSRPFVPRSSQEMKGRTLLDAIAAVETYVRFWLDRQPPATADEPDEDDDPAKETTGAT